MQISKMISLLIFEYECPSQDKTNAVQLPPAVGDEDSMNMNDKKPWQEEVRACET